MQTRSTAAPLQLVYISSSPIIYEEDCDRQSVSNFAVMPLIGVYSWSEKKDLIKVVVPLKGASPNKVDIFVTSSTLKVNFSPYIVNIVLRSDIDPIKHKATVKDGNLLVTLYKTDASHGIWGALEVDTEDKTVILKLREESQTAQDALEKELGEKRKDRRTEDERFSLRKQMGLDEAERSRLDNLKLEEKRSAEEEVYATFSRMEAEKHSANESAITQQITKPKPVEVKAKEPVDFDTYMQEKNAKALLAPAAVADSKDIFDVASIPIIDIDKEQFDNDDTDHFEAKSVVENNAGAIVPSSRVNVIEVEVDDVRYIPPPRAISHTTDGKGKVDIHFTPRVFPTPMRESKIAEEDDWIAKNRRHLKKHGVLGGNVTKGADTSEEDPAWLKAKGDDFYRGGDYLSALNVYSAAIDMNEHMTACYSNRSACYLRLNMLAESRLDCTEGIRQVDEELSAISTSNAAASALSNTATNEVIALKSLVSKLLLRRGSANCQMGIFSEALNDYTRASNLLFGYENKSDINKNKSDERYEEREFSLPGITRASLTADLSIMVRLLNADILKKEGDALFADNMLPESALKYEEALLLVPVHVGCLSNRSACRLAMKDVEGCIEDCSAALGLLRDGDSQDSSSTEISMLKSILPVSGSEKRSSWVVKTLLRRGAAFAQVGRLDEAVDDLRAASARDPKNETLKSDLNKIINFREGKRAANS